MKKLSLLATILLMSLSGINAQQEKVNVNPEIDPNVPYVVLAAIEADNPGINMRKRPTASAEVIKKAKKPKKISAWPSQTFQVQYSGKDYLKRVIYDKEGNFLYSKEHIRNVAMPDAVYKYIGKEFNGWMIKKAAVVKTVDKSRPAPRSRSTVYYKVLLQNGKKKERILLNEHGEVYSRKHF